MCQISWLMTLVLAVIGVSRNRGLNINFVSLTVLGGLVFLIIFESGGTKYMLQYLSYICLLAGVGSKVTWYKIVM